MVDYKLTWKVDNLISKLIKDEYKISPEAYKIHYGNESLGKLLFEAIDNYEKSPIFSNEYQTKDLVSWINRAFAEGVVLDNTDLISKLNEKEQYITKLEEENRYWKEKSQKHATDLVYWQGQYDNIEKQFNKAFKHGDDIYHE